MEEKDKELTPEKISLFFLTQSTHYLALAENALQEMERSGNAWMLTSDRQITPEEYSELTKWSDFVIIFPTLFSFYHGLELMIKGLLAISNPNVPEIHKFSELFSAIKNTELKDSEILKIAERYLTIGGLTGTPLGTWLKNNSLTPDDLNERLRYPFKKGQKKPTRDHDLKYQEEKMIPFIKQMHSDSLILRKLYVNHLRSMKKD